MEKIPEDELTKQVLLKNLKRQKEIRKLILPLLAIVFLFLNVFLPSNPSSILGGILVLVSFSLFFFGNLYFQKNPQLTVSAIQQILLKIIFLELLAAWAGFYLFGPLIGDWLIPIAFPASLFFIFYLTLVIPLLAEFYRTFFYLISWLGLTFLILLGHSQFALSLSTHQLTTEIINIPSLVSIVLAGIAVFGVKIVSDSTRDRTDWWNQGLEAVNRRLEGKLTDREEIIFELRQKLKETKEILQIRTLAQMREMKRLTERFQQTVGEMEASQLKNNQLPTKAKEAQETAQALLNILEDSEKARQALLEEEELTRTIIDNFVDGLIILNSQGIIQEVNQRIEKDFQVKEDNLQGQPLEILKKYPLISPVISIVGGSDRLRSVRKKEFSPQKGITIEVSTVVLKSRGQCLGYLLVFHDVSREKNIQKMKTDFVSIAAHQLRTPLSAIKWSIKMILDGEAGKITASQKKWLDKTYQSNERLIALVNDLLNVSHIEEGKFLYELQKSDLKEIVKTALDENEEAIKHKELKISFKKELESFPVFVDQEKIRLAIQNLVNNAIHYTPPKGKIDLSLRSEDGQFFLSIKDSGIGISKNDQKKVFERFFRGRNAIKMRTSGTGLGLFITKNIIEAHQGKIWFESQLGKGTTFFLTLPQSNG